MDPTLYDLLVQDLRLLHAAESEQAVRAVELANGVADEGLRTVLLEHAAQTEEQVRRLQSIIEDIGEEPSEEIPMAVQGLLGDAELYVDQELPADVRDIAIAAAARKIESYEIACYESALLIAGQLGIEVMVNALTESYEEERQVDVRIAEAVIPLLQRVVGEQAAVSEE